MGQCGNQRKMVRQDNFDTSKDIDDLAGNGVEVKHLLDILELLFSCHQTMQHFDPRRSTTHDVNRHVIIPFTDEGCVGSGEGAAESVGSGQGAAEGESEPKMWAELSHELSAPDDMRPTANNMSRPKVRFKENRNTQPKTPAESSDRKSGRLSVVSVEDDTSNNVSWKEYRAVKSIKQKRVSNGASAPEDLLESEEEKGMEEIFKRAMALAETQGAKAAMALISGMIEDKAQATSARSMKAERTTGVRKTRFSDAMDNVTDVVNAQMNAQKLDMEARLAQRRNRQMQDTQAMVKTLTDKGQHDDARKVVVAAVKSLKKDADDSEA